MLVGTKRMKNTSASRSAFTDAISTRMGIGGILLSLSFGCCDDAKSPIMGANE
jgi:hypothetical protein